MQKDTGVSSLRPLVLYRDTGKSQKCHLLELPAELRESIWAYSSTKESIDVWIFMTDDEDEVRSEPEPGLLSTCRQIRNEALPIYYTSYNFTIECKDWNMSKIVALEAKCRAMGILNKVKMRLPIEDHFGWPTITMWCKHLHDRGTWCPSDDDCIPMEWRDLTCSGAFDIAKNMRDATWETCVRVLDSFFRTMELAQGKCRHPHRL